MYSVYPDPDRDPEIKVEEWIAEAMGVSTKAAVKSFDNTGGTPYNAPIK